ncbi:unnamed protein product [Schistosoma margrebowiei]|uniref:Uncharacterized protein n=1 Tax=Schistosoma margrebowiei TaxID=48269 RepID=A0A183N9I0_9TREM|nr:unnamed protein product [Schistosoma margrebowiei]
MRSVKPASTQPQSTDVFVQPDSRYNTHVFVRRDSHRRPSESAYEGLFKVLQRESKYYIVDKNGTNDSISIDRSNAAYLEGNPIHVDFPSVQSHNTTPTLIIPQPTTNTSDDTLNVSENKLKTTRSGRRIRFPEHLNDYCTTAGKERCSLRGAEIFIVNFLFLLCCISVPCSKERRPDAAKLRELVDPSSSTMNMDLTSYTNRLTNAMRSVKPASTQPQSTDVFVQPDSRYNTHVFVRRDSHRRPSESAYEGLFKVLQRESKYYIVDKNGTNDSISIDCLNAAYLEGNPIHVDFPSVQSHNTTPTLIIIIIISSQITVCYMRHASLQARSN